MAIKGIGTDIVQLHRIEALWRQYGNRFAKRLLAEVELKELEAQQNKVAFLGKRFAAKEAVSKALGCGIGEHCAFTDIVIIHNPQGKPAVKLIGKAQMLCHDKTVIHISISDERDQAIAFVIIETLG